MRKTFTDVDDVAIACIYFNHKEHITPVEIIGNLLKQLLERNSSLSGEAQELYDRHCQRQTRPTFLELLGLLKLEAHRISSIFIVVDALDECSGSEDVAAEILRELEKLSTSRLMITGRPNVANLVSRLEASTTFEIRATDEDIHKTLETEIDKSVFLSECVRGDEILRRSIVNTITEKADGM